MSGRPAPVSYLLIASRITHFAPDTDRPIILAKGRCWSIYSLQERFLP
jgi:hypothetical protein